MVVQDSKGATYCLKHLYGEDGVKVLKAVRADVDADEYRTKEGCSEKYRITKIQDLGI